VSARLDQRLAAALGGFAAGRDAIAASPRVTELTAGALNHVYRVTSAVGDWVVRLGGGVDADLAINRVAERQIHKVVAERGFAPQIVHAAPAAGLLVTEFVDGARVSRERLRQPETLRALGTRLAELHRAPVPGTVRRVDVHDVLLHHLELGGVPPGPVSREDLASRLRWSLANYRQVGIALCHNDLHHRNLLAGGGAGLVFVDWEYGGAGDPLFELAAIIGYHDLDEEQCAILLAAHGGPFRPVDVAAMCLVFDCLHALWLDSARAWGSLEAGQRDALLARLAIDPADREE
jgi:thiamine kinase-like enzyme